MVNVETEKTTLLKPLFVNGIFNRAGKKSHFLPLPRNADYNLYLKLDAPDHNECTLYVGVGDYVASTKLTFKMFVWNCGLETAMVKLYGEPWPHNRAHALAAATPDEREALLEKEEKLVLAAGQPSSVQTAHLKAWLDKAVENYRAAVESADAGAYEKHPDFIGAAYLNDLPRCCDISKVYKERLEQREEAKQAELLDQRRAEMTTLKGETDAAISAAIANLKAGKTISNDPVSVVAEDGLSFQKVPIILCVMDRFGITLPGRTRGWLVENLGTMRLNDDDSVGVYHRGNGRLPQGVTDRLLELAKAIKADA